MPETQATLEHQLRTEPALEQQQLHEQTALERQAEQSVQMDLE